MSILYFFNYKNIFFLIYKKIFFTFLLMIYECRNVSKFDRIFLHLI